MTTDMDMTSASSLSTVLEYIKDRLSATDPEIPSGWIDPESFPRIICTGARYDPDVAPGLDLWPCVAQFRITVNQAVDYMSMLDMISLLTAKLRRYVFGASTPARVTSVSIDPWSMNEAGENKARIMFELELALGSPAMPSGNDDLFGTVFGGPPPDDKPFDPKIAYGWIGYADDAYAGDGPPPDTDRGYDPDTYDQWWPEVEDPGEDGL